MFHHTLRPITHAEAVEKLFGGQGWQGGLSESSRKWAQQAFGEHVHGEFQLPGLLWPWLVWILGMEICQEVRTVGQVTRGFPCVCTPGVAFPVHLSGYETRSETGRLLGD